MVDFLLLVSKVATYTENRMKTELSGPHTKAFVGVYRLRQVQATLAEPVEAKIHIQ